LKSIINKLLIIFFILLSHYHSGFGQNLAKSYSINWFSDSVQVKQNTVSNISTEFPRYLPSKFGNFPSVYLKIPVNGLNNTVSVDLNKTSAAILSTSSGSENTIKSDIQLSYHTVLENKKPFLLINFLPVFQDQDGLKKVDEYSLQINSLAESGMQVKNLRSYASNSILSSGSWYKIAVKEEGIYKITYDFLKNLGVDVTAIDPRNIRVYGNGGFMLPQNNSQNRIDDLQENAIQVLGESDGKFDNSDYVLFYAQGNTKWSLNANKQYFEHQNNVYTDSSYYFINIDKGLGKRISQISGGSLAPNYSTNEYDDHQLYEKDLYTLITLSLKSGRNWYGEDFEFNNSRNFDFNISGVQPNAPLFLKTNMAMRSNVAASASVKLNGQALYNLQANSLPLNFETDFARESSALASLNGINTSNLTVNITYNKPNSTSNAWLDYLELNCRRQLSGAQNFLRFRDKASVGANNYTQFNFNNVVTGAQIWDLTNPLQPFQQNYSNSGANASFTVNTNILKEFVLFNPLSFKEPVALGKIQNQNLHGLASADLIIITAPEWFSEAKRLADFRKAEQNLSYQIVMPNQIFNEFSSGGREATAMRDFVKMFYDRAGFNSQLAPKYLLLFGKGSFDQKNIKFKNNDFVPTYQSRNSLSPTESYTSDDYFGLLDDNEGDFLEDYSSNPGLLDIAIGRIPVKSLTEAKDVVDKLISYSSQASFGDWRNQVTIIADDEDNNLHLNQAEANAAAITQRTQKPNIDKIYFDAYQQESAAGGNRYPEVEAALNQKVNSGSLLINYTGHGGESGWAEERVLTIPSINLWNNPNKFPIIFTATCSFGRWDDPEVTSAGELTLLKKNAGVPALFTTTRIVFASYNFDLNQSFLRSLYNPALFSRKMTFGEVFKAAKNDNIGGLNINSRNFTLLGDPSTLFPIPINNIITSSINNKSVGVADTLKAGQKVNVKGIITNENGQKINNFNGFIYPLIYDKPSTVTTLANDRQTNGSYEQAFNLQKNIIYKGKATVISGDFSFDFIIPKDINLQVAKGKMSYYADNSSTDASGAFTDVLIGGISNSGFIDKVGPTIKTFLNDEKFISGSITNTSPVLLVKLNDESGINTTGIGIGHDIVATLTSQNEQDKAIILNQYYQATLDSYQEGTVRYPIAALAPGLYSLKIKAWDVFNNSSEQTITFEVKSSEQLTLTHVLNYPNPFTIKTSFQFQHNHPNEDLEVQINIKTVSGRLIKTINQLVNSTGNTVNDIFWDGKDDFGEKIARGVYIYELKVRSSVSGNSVQKIEKLVLL
jgi:hypothetical protein